MSTPGIILSFLCSILLQAIVFAQTETHVTQITERDGLSYRWVFDIIQDHRGFLWFGTYDGLNRYDGQNFVVYEHSASDPNTLSSSIVIHVAEDSHGGIWTYGYDLVFNRIDLASGRISRVDGRLKDGLPYQGPKAFMLHFAPLTNGDFIALFQEAGRNSCTFWKYNPDLNALEFIIRVPTRHGLMNYFSERTDGKVWLWGLAAGYFLVDLDARQYFEYPIENLATIPGSIVPLPVDEDRNLWYPSDTIGIDSGGIINKYKLPQDLDLKQIHRIRSDNHSNLWFSYGDSALYQFNVHNSTLQKFTDPFLGQLLDYETMPRCFVGAEAACWVGHFYGAARIGNRTPLFQSFALNSETQFPSRMDDFSAREIVQWGADKLIVKRNDYALFILDRTTHEMDELVRRPMYQSNTPLPTGVRSMFIGSDGFLWNNQGSNLVKTDLETGLFEVFDGPPVPAEDIRRIFQDQADMIWWCSTAGVYLFDSDGRNMMQLKYDALDETIQPNFEFASYDPSSNLIFASYQSGIYVIDCSSKTSSVIEVFRSSESDYQVMAIEYWHDEYWLSTDRGLVRYNHSTGKRTIYNRKDGLPSHIIYSALGGENDLWIATHNGLSRFDPLNERFTNYYEEDGLPFNEFNRWSWLRTKDGHLFFGGLNGVIGFDPKDFKVREESKGNLNLLGLTSYDQRNDETKAIIHNPFSIPAKVVVGPYERTLAFQYALPLFEDVSKNHYFHMLDGLEHDWVDDGNQNEARYIQIPPGEYVFRARALGPDGTPARNEIAIPITIKQYWYLRWWAISTYALFTALAIFKFYRFQLSRKMDKQETKRLRELEEVKSRLYTNITHEFRTPLTVMLGMNEAVKGYASKGDMDKVYHSTEMIDRNARNLLDLVNQMLDLSKLEAGMMEVHNTHADVLAYLRYRLEAFQSYAAEKQITITFSSPAEEILMDFDPDRISHIVNNLMSNAIKFTPDHGSIFVSAAVTSNGSKQRFLEFTVQDTGIGIEEDKLPHIFERFYQVNSVPLRKGEGTGVGLSLVHELVRLLGGSISVQSKSGEGATFTVLLPITNRAIKEKPPATKDADIIDQDLAIEDMGDELPLVLIVEDSADVMHYIQISIESGYRAVTASDGREGIDKAIDLIPDLIISDVMMPGTDGFALCEAVKKDERTSHIPVILLTAKSDHTSKLEGLEFGADVYLTKPFDQKELLIRMRNLLALRAEIQKRFVNQTETTPETHREAAFLVKIKSLIAERMHEDEFNVDQLCRLSFLSRAQLHRKVTALTGQSVSRLIRSVRLNRAKELLTEGHLNVSEVAHEVGFKAQSHFSRVFTEDFGVSPTEFKSGKN